MRLGLSSTCALISLSGRWRRVHFRGVLLPLSADEVASSGPAWSAAALNVGDWLDAKDAIGEWAVASVAAATEASVTVHFKGWSDRWATSDTHTSPVALPIESHFLAMGTGLGVGAQCANEGAGVGWVCSGWGREGVCV